MIQVIKNQLTQLKFHRALIPIRQMWKALADVYPSMLLQLNARKRDALVNEFKLCSTVRDCMEFTKQHMGAGSVQIPWEIEAAITLIADSRPKVMCEIGTSDGGTSMLFIKFLPTVELMLCIDLHVKNKKMLKLLASPGQQLHFVDMPSYSDAALDKVAQVLNGRAIDALFIDGDHTYEGVKQDFLCYRHFVRNDGLILFHDIVEDRGRDRAWAGGVPKIWNTLAPYYHNCEFVNSRDQEGFGIGALTYSRTARPPIVT